MFSDSLGCFTDKKERAMNGLFKTSDTMTVELCKNYCRDNRYLFAALQVSNLQLLIGSSKHFKVINSCLKIQLIIRHVDLYSNKTGVQS